MGRLRDWVEFAGNPVLTYRHAETPVLLSAESCSTHFVPVLLSHVVLDFKGPPDAPVFLAIANFKSVQ